MEIKANKHSIFTNTNSDIKLNTDTVFKPLRSYFLYLILRVIKSLSTVIVLVLTLIASIVLSIMPIFFDADIRLLVMRIIPAILMVTMVVFSATFAITKSLKIFVGFQSEGTELIIISKPISRNQILLVKFIFLAILGIIYSGIVAAFSCIGFAVVGFDVYSDAGITIQGIFVSVLIAYMIMGLVAIAISLVTGSSDKLAKALPSLVLSISAIVSLMAPQLISLTTQNPATEQINQFEKSLLEKSIVAPDLKYNGFDVKSLSMIKNQRSFLPFSYDKTNSSLFFIGDLLVTYTEGSVDKFFPITASTFRAGETPKQDDINMYQFATNVAVQEFQTNGIKITGQGWTAFNYLNPISAFVAISGSSISFTSRSDFLPYNYNFEGFKLGGPLLSTIDQAIYPASISIEKIQQLDPIWALATLWASIWILLGVLTIVAYKRKDFK